MYYLFIQPTPSDRHGQARPHAMDKTRRTRNRYQLPKPKPFAPEIISARLEAPLATYTLIRDTAGSRTPSDNITLKYSSDSPRKLFKIKIFDERRRRKIRLDNETQSIYPSNFDSAFVHAKKGSIKLQDCQLHTFKI